VHRARKETKRSIRPRAGARPACAALNRAINFRASNCAGALVSLINGGIYNRLVTRERGPPLPRLLLRLFRRRSPRGEEINSGRRHAVPDNLLKRPLVTRNRSRCFARYKYAAACPLPRGDIKIVALARLLQRNARSRPLGKPPFVCNQTLRSSLIIRMPSQGIRMLP